LVLIDGRAVYTPSFSGVFWDEQDLPPEDIERIEVIRGPGGTVWGANAVNGVINIITRNANATPGGVFSASAGLDEDVQGLLQYGGKIGKKGAYRAFGRYFAIGRSGSPPGGEANDGLHMFHEGFRSDWDLSRRDAMTLQGNVLQEGERQSILLQGALNTPPRAFTDKVAVTAGNVLGRWNHTLAGGSDMSLQVYYDGHHRLDGGTREARDTVDLDFHDHLGSRNDIVWGLGYRFSNERFVRGVSIALPPHSTESLFSTFLQDEIRVTDSLALTLGSKFEHNAYTGFEYEPSAQIVWSVSGRQAIWLSAARAVRQPALTDVGLDVDVSTFAVNASTLGQLKILGTPHPKAEQLRDYEAGYRAQVSKRLSLDVATFLSYYRRLQTYEPHDPFFTASPAPPHLVFPVVVDYLAHARNYGAELFASWSVINRWRISPGFSTLHVSVVRAAASQDSSVETTPGDSPKHRYRIGSLLNLRRNLDWDSSVSYTGRLTNGNIPGYTQLDSRLTWRLGESLELSAIGQNLLRPRHEEFHDAFQVLHTEIERSVLGKITWRF
jgi:iron complex outermembrane receptor protein